MGLVKKTWLNIIWGLTEALALWILTTLSVDTVRKYVSHQVLFQLEPHREVEESSFSCVMLAVSCQYSTQWTWSAVSPSATLCWQVAKIDISYAKTAKRVDVRKLKSAMWNLLTSHTPPTAQSQVAKLLTLTLPFLFFFFFLDLCMENVSTCKNQDITDQPHAANILTFQFSWTLQVRSEMCNLDGGSTYWTLPVHTIILCAIRWMRGWVLDWLVCRKGKNVVVVFVICLDKVMVLVFFVQSSSALLKYTQSRDCMCGIQTQSSAAETVCAAYRCSLVLRDCMCGVQMQSSAAETVCVAYRCSPVQSSPETVQHTDTV